MSSKLESDIPFHNLNTRNFPQRKRAKTPSFSSILLDAMYRSIDEDHGEYPRTTPTSPTHQLDYQGSSNKMRSDSTLETLDLRRAIMVDSWMDNQQQQSQQKQRHHHFHLGDVLDHKVRMVRQKSVPNTNDLSSCFTNLAPRSSSRHQSSSRIFTKTKSRALKIYGDFKKSTNPNTPISPGRRIAAFLNSIFRNSATTPPRHSPEINLNPPPTAAPATTSNSTCSSVSSFSRSCLSNKTSSSDKSTPAIKRSVRFYPVSVIVDEDSRPCGHKSLQKIENEQSKKITSPPMSGSGCGGVEQRRWRREKEIDTLMKMIKENCSSSSNNNKNQRRNVSSFEEDSDEEDDGDSCASSDLFELENLNSVGANRYCQELPVYGTTSLKDLSS